jgi:hypothetical protein
MATVAAGERAAVAAAAGTPPLTATRRSTLLDYFRVPYAVPDHDDGGRNVIEAVASGRRLYLPPAGEVPRRLVRLGGITFAASVGGEPPPGHDWRPAEPILDEDGGTVAHVLRDRGGNVALPFDPDDAIHAFWSESYALTGSRGRARIRRLALRTYYLVRPLLPRAAQLRLRRLFKHAQSRSRFPRWPVETSLHDLYGWLLAELAGLAGEPLPTIAPWPRGLGWALVLTHDVETAAGVESVDVLRRRELEAGVRSAWNFVPERYRVEESLLEKLRSEGFEIGVHGLRHDGRDLASLRTLRRRLPRIRAAAERWHAVGWRSPATHRVWDWMPLLGFDYDSSSPDTDPYEPQPGGCCSWLPFFNRNLVELPVTLVQDHTLFVILGRSDEQAWIEKTAYLRDRGGMALSITHPDYMADEPRAEAYGRYLAAFADDPTAWKALPREVSAWWRRRAASSLELVDGGWRVAGPAAHEARIAYVAPPVQVDA